MELLVATWIMRVAIVAALAVGFVSYQSGAATIDCVDRALASAVAFLIAGRWLIGWLEPPEKKMLRMRIKRARKKSKSRKPPSPERLAEAGARANSTISRTA
jgi:membrane protein implicated in regulation of membrane protease activity